MKKQNEELKGVSNRNVLSPFLDEIFYNPSTVKAFIEEVESKEYHYITKLISTSTLDLYERECIWNDIEDGIMTVQDAINFLLMNQLDPIEAGLNYSQGDIQKKLNEVDRDERK